MWTGPRCFPRRSWGKLWDSNKIYCFLRDQSLSDSLYGWKFIKPRCNSGRRSTFAGNSALLPSDIIDFPMLPAQIFWCQTVSLLDVMWPRSNQWERALRKKKFQLYNNPCYNIQWIEHHASNARQFTVISFCLGILQDSAIPTSYVGPVGDTKRQLDLSIPEATSTPSKVSTPRRRCGALTRTGSACKNVISKGSLKCRRHSRMESSFIPDEC